MANSLKLARKALGFLGKSKAQTRVLGKNYAKELQSVVAGKPRKVKKQFYKLYQEFVNNPENKELQAKLESHIGESKTVHVKANAGKQADIERACEKVPTVKREYVPTESEKKLDEILSKNGIEPEATSYDYDYKAMHKQLSEEVFGDIYYGFHKRAAVQEMKSELISPIVIHNKKVKLIRDISKAKQDIVKTIEESNQKLFSEAAAEVTSSESINRILRGAYKSMLIDSIKRFFYPITKPLSMLLSKESRAVFQKTMNLPQHKFGKAFYEELVKTKGLAERAPKEFSIKYGGGIAGGSSDIIGGFSMEQNTIEFTSKFVELPKWAQASLVTHELKHFEQADKVIRTFGIEKYIEAVKLSIIKQNVTSVLNAGKSKEEIVAQVEAYWTKDDIPEKIRKAFSSSIDAEKIAIDSKQGKQAQKYLKGIQNYVLPDGITPGTDMKYFTNPLEIGAYKAQGNKGLQAFIFQSAH